MSLSDWGFDPSALLDAAIQMSEHGDETEWARVCLAARTHAHPPETLSRLGLSASESMALALALTLADGHPAADSFFDEKNGLTLPLLAQLISPDAAHYPTTLTALADGELLRRRVLLSGGGPHWAQLGLSPQLLQQRASRRGQHQDLNRLLQRLQAHHPLVPRSGLPSVQGFQVLGVAGSGRKSALLAAAGQTPVYLANSARFYQFDAQEELLADVLTFVDLNHGWLVWPDTNQLADHPTLLAQIEQWLAGHPARRFVRLAENGTDAPVMLTARWSVGLPVGAEALALWQALLPADWPALTGLAELAERYPLLPGDVRHIAQSVQGPPNLAVLQQACLAHQPSSLGALARRVSPRLTLREMTLADSERQALCELILRYRERHRLKAQGLCHGDGLTALFWGKPGTGKTLAAHALAAELALPLYQVNLAQVSSKWIGETEKHLAALFDAAERQSCVLFFDEADAVFGKRSEVKDSHDRNANLSVSYLLQRLDESSALAILASNFKQNLDPAFLRRFALTIEFTPPDAGRRRLLWQSHAARLMLPASPLAALAENFELTPAQISNVVLGSHLAALAYPAQSPAQHVAHALAREFDKTDQRYPMRERIDNWLQGSFYV